MDDLKQLLENNQSWAQERLKRDPEFFTHLNEGQAPEYLWIGCCDSRMPAEIITGLGSGDMLVHRNIANQVLPIDTNVNSILQFALTVLKIRKVIIAGHYNCGGVGAALSGQVTGDMAEWLRGIQDTYSNHEIRFKGLETDQEKADALSELNVAQQVMNVSRSDVVKQVWAGGEPLAIYGMIYDLKTGKLNDLDLCIKSLDQAAAMEKLYT